MTFADQLTALGIAALGIAAFVEAVAPGAVAPGAVVPGIVGPEIVGPEIVGPGVLALLMGSLGAAALAPVALGPVDFGCAALDYFFADYHQHLSPGRNVRRVENNLRTRFGRQLSAHPAPAPNIYLEFVAGSREAYLPDQRFRNCCGSGW